MLLLLLLVSAALNRPLASSLGRPDEPAVRRCSWAELLALLSTIPHGVWTRGMLLVGWHVFVLGSTSPLPSCCDDTCTKLSLVAEAEALIPNALTYATEHCCSGCAPGKAVELPGRCLDVFAGYLEDHRVVDIWDCDVQFDWQRWRWGAHGSLVNVHSDKCLSVYSYSPPHVEQSANCSTRWAFTRTFQLKEVDSGLCLFVDGRVSGKDRDANFTIFPQGSNTDWNTFGGETNGAHLSLTPCSASATPPGDQLWHQQYESASGGFALRSGLIGSSALFGGVPSTWYPKLGPYPGLSRSSPALRPSFRITHSSLVRPSWWEAATTAPCRPAPARQTLHSGRGGCWPTVRRRPPSGVPLAPHPPAQYRLPRSTRTLHCRG